jgi:hypothetical protein
MSGDNVTPLRPLTADERRFSGYLTRIKDVPNTGEIAFHGGKVHMTLRSFDALTEAAVSNRRAAEAVEKLAGTDGRPSDRVTGYHCTTHKLRIGTKMALQLHMNASSGICVVNPLRESASPEVMHFRNIDSDYTACGTYPGTRAFPLDGGKHDATDNWLRVSCNDCLAAGGKSKVDWSTKPIAEVQAAAEKQRAIKLTGEFTEPPLVTSPYKPVPQHHCEEWMMAESNGPGRYCGGCGKQEEAPEPRAKHEGPHWTHDCDSCDYLGSETDAQGRWNDLYYCPPNAWSRRPNLIARHGEMGDYTSGMEWVGRDGMLALAFVLALRAGKIRTADLG